MPVPTVPIFNLSYDWWLPGNAPPAPPDVQDVCQLYYFSKFPPTSAVFRPFGEIRVARQFWSNIAIPTIDGLWRLTDFFGNKWYYKTIWWDYFHLGMPNEYICNVVEQCDATRVTPDPTR